MASVQEPEVQFAQRLASNEKPVRNKAMKKLRKYISVRSQTETGGFTGEELLKLWKGLFYCLWMQDKPLLQEELSKQISSLIHNFQNVKGQFLYLESFMQTFKREWTGIDRLRMDKFFQLVRFMFRQTFEMLQRQSWESSVVSSFLELLTSQLLRGDSGAPSGLQFHILDLYMSELAAVGSAELTADQNLVFIEPFCKTAAKTKDRTLFRAICSSIFSTIIDQAPFAIEDLMKEMKAAEASDSDSGQASEEEEEDEERGEKTTSKPVGKKAAGKQMNGIKSSAEEEEDDDDELLHLEDSDTEAPCDDDDVGPVLQFDYVALADKLLELSSRSGTPSHNRQGLYKIIKVLRDLSEGVFPQDEYPEEVSTDEDDDMFGSRKRMKRGLEGRPRGEAEEEAPASKKSKGKKKETSACPNNDSAKDEAGEETANSDKKKKKRKKKKKKKAVGGENAEKSEQIMAESKVQESQTESLISVSSVRVTEAATAEGVSETLLLSEVKKQPSVTVTEEHSSPTPCTPEDDEEQQPDRMNALQPTGEVSFKDTVSGKKKKKKKGLTMDEIVKVSETTLESTTPKKRMKTPDAEELLEAESKVNGVTADEAEKKPTDSTASGKKKSKKKKAEAAEVEIASAGEEVSPDDATAQTKATPLEASPAADESTVTPLKKKKGKKNQEESKTTVEEEGATSETPLVTDAEKPITMTTPAKKKKKKLSAACEDEVRDQTAGQAVGSEEAELPADEASVLSSSGKSAKKKKRKIPVVFEFEADEVDAAASVNGLAEEETAAKKTKLVSNVGEPSTPLSTKKSQKKTKSSSAARSDFVTFQTNAAVPTPLFCKTKGSPGTPLSSKKKIKTPKSESKKVTFGLKNNKTAEFKKTDRSLLVSPDGSSRVPFDPKQKPKFGVLKSPATPASKGKKTPTGAKKGGASAPKSTPKRRPSAADFF